MTAQSEAFRFCAAEGKHLWTLALVAQRVHFRARRAIQLLTRVPGTSMLFPDVTGAIAPVHAVRLHVGVAHRVPLTAFIVGTIHATLAGCCVRAEVHNHEIFVRLPRHFGDKGAQTRAYSNDATHPSVNTSELLLGVFRLPLLQAVVAKEQEDPKECQKAKNVPAKAVAAVACATSTLPAIQTIIWVHGVIVVPRAMRHCRESSGFSGR